MAKKQPAGNNGRTPDGKFAKGNAHAWQKGVSANPSGRPRDTITPHLKEIAQEQDNDGRTYGRRVAEMLYAESLGGNVTAAKEILDRLDGKPRQTVDLSVDDKRKAALETVIAGLVATGMSEDAAKQYLAAVTPEVKDWIN